MRFVSKKKHFFIDIWRFSQKWESSFSSWKIFTIKVRKTFRRKNISSKHSTAKLSHFLHFKKTKVSKQKSNTQPDFSKNANFLSSGWEILLYHLISILSLLEFDQRKFQTWDSSYVRTFFTGKRNLKKRTVGARDSRTTSWETLFGPISKLTTCTAFARVTPIFVLRWFVWKALWFL